MQAFLIENGSSVEFVGNRTECALLMLLRSWEISYKTLREAFSHRIERVSVLLHIIASTTLLQGLAEVVRQYVNRRIQGLFALL